MFSSIIRSTRTTVSRNVRQFSLTSTRSNLVSDLYIRELKSFKPTPISTADAESATKAWKLPTAAKPLGLEGEGADALAEYDTATVEVASGSGSGSAVVQEYKPDDWFVFEEEVEPGHHH